MHSVKERLQADIAAGALVGCVHEDDHGKSAQDPAEEMWTWAGRHLRGSGEFA
jgi:hypothetical protein